MEGIHAPRSTAVDAPTPRPHTRRTPPRNRTVPTSSLKLAILTAAILTALAGPVSAADPPPPVEKLIEQLGHPSFPVRERASKALRERGPEVLPALRKAMESKDEEVRKRAESLIPALEIEEALLPKRVTIKASDTPLNQVLQDIEKQTGQKVSLGATKERIGKVTLDAANVPFWDVLEQ